MDVKRVLFLVFTMHAVNWLCFRKKEKNNNSEDVHGRYISNEYAFFRNKIY